MFENELDTFRKLQSELKAKHPEGGFAVIRDKDLLGVWKDRSDALSEGIKAYGYVPFLVKDINEDLDDVTNVINLSRDIVLC